MPVIDKKLIEEEVKHLPESGNRVVWDDATKGFGICITAAGNVSFIFNYYVKGDEGKQKQRRITIGRYPSEYPDIDDAIDKARELRRKVYKEGIDPLEEKRKDQIAEEQEQNDQRTIMDLANFYLEQYAKREKRKKSQYEDKRMIEGIIRNHIGQVAAKEPYIELRECIEDLKHDLRSTPVQANRVMSLLSKIFNFGIDKGWRTDNPARKIPKYTEERREKFLDAEQVARLTQALNAYPSQDAADVIRLALLTGARPGEILNAEWKQFDLKHRKHETWTKPTLATKQKKPHEVPLNGPAVKVLKKRYAARKDGCSYVFPGEDGKHALTTIRWAWNKICETAKLGSEYTKTGKRGKPLKRWRPTFEDGTPLRPYDCRHTYASHLVNKRESLEVIGANLGHTKLETTRRYAHLNDAVKREASNQIGTMFRGLGA